MSTLSKTIIPFLDESSSRIQEASKILSPIGGTGYVHRQNEVKQKHNAKLTFPGNKLKSVHLKRIELAYKNERTPLRAITNSLADSRPVTRGMILTILLLYR